MACPLGTFAYTVKAGDTLYNLAQRFNTSVSAIVAVNPGINPSALQIGQTVCIPGNRPNRPCPVGSFAYAIKTGDTLYKIAQQYSTTVDAIIAANPGLNPNNLQVGQVICVPGRRPGPGPGPGPMPPGPGRRCPVGSFAYMIQAGDTLFKIAQKNNTTVQAIINLNPGINPNSLQIGQMICVPGVRTTEPQIQEAEVQEVEMQEVEMQEGEMQAVEARQLRTCPSGSFAYTIKSGDTFYKLAQTYNTTVEAIRALNPGLDPYNLQIGQVICIPGGSQPQVCPPGSFAYTIKSGDTFYKLAQTYNTTVEAIRALNPGLDPYNLQIGQVICIPGGSQPQPKPCPGGSFAYTVKLGDTVYSIAQTYRTTVEAIMALNPGLNVYNLQVGQVICVPKPCPGNSFQYIVKSGDTIFMLAQKYNTTVEAIMAINLGIDPYNLQIGQVICIPKPCPANSFSYTVKLGDTIFSIAQKYNTTVDAIMMLNPGVDPYNLQVGQTLCIPKPCPPNSLSYTVKPGDTIYSIAQKYNTTVEAIMMMNPGVDPYNLQVGQVICVPKHLCPPGSFPYTIKPGDTIYSIAQRYNTTVDAIMMLNPGLNPYNLQVGQVICVPGCPPGSFLYTIKPGDTLYSIAQRYNTTVNAIMMLNPGLDPYNLQIGQRICVPGYQCPPGSFPYTIKAGDTLYSIAQRYGTSVQAIMALNPGIDPNNLQIGQVICVPGTMPTCDGTCPE